MCFFLLRTDRDSPVSCVFCLSSRVHVTYLSRDIKSISRLLHCSRCMLRAKDANNEAKKGRRFCPQQKQARQLLIDRQRSEAVFEGYIEHQTQDQQDQYQARPSIERTGDSSNGHKTGQEDGNRFHLFLLRFLHSLVDHPTIFQPPCLSAFQRHSSNGSNGANPLRARIFRATAASLTCLTGSNSCLGKNTPVRP